MTITQNIHASCRQKASTALRNHSDFTSLEIEIGDGANGRISLNIFIQKSASDLLRWETLLTNLASEIKNLRHQIES